jgi:GT2 family glycosyltransferase
LLRVLSALGGEFPEKFQMMLDALAEPMQQVDGQSEGWPPVVSIIIPVYNGALTITACLDSLLNQDYPAQKYEILVVDNASKDQTVELVHQYTSRDARVSLLSETKILNAYGARNRAAQCARGKILAFTDADCMARTNWLSELVQPFQDVDVGCVAGDRLRAAPRNLIEKYTSDEMLTARPDPGESFSRVLGANCAIRQSVFVELGGFRTYPPSGGDTEFAHRMIEKTPFKVAVNLRAVVEHRNIDTLRGLVKQFVRYGTAARHQGGLFNQNRRTLGQMVRITMGFAGSFVKRAILYLSNRIPESVAPADADIYVCRPGLRIICEWSAYIGSKSSARVKKLVR